MKKIQSIKMNVIKGFMILLVIVISASCAEDILDKIPVTEITAETINTEDRVLQAINAAYDPLQWKLEGPAETFQQMFQGVRADDIHSQQANFWGNGAVFDQFSTIRSTNQSVAELWRKLYAGVGRANFALDLTQEFNGFVTDGLKERIIAEAKFLRGFYYFELVKLFGDVPLFIEAIRTTEDELYLPRSPKADVYAQIEKDLTEAASVLPKRGESAELWRATSGAALGILAKAQLYQGKYSETVASCQQIMTHGYQLEPIFSDNFELNNEFGIESLFEINYVDGIPGEGSISWQYMFMWAGGIYTSWGNMIPRQSLVNFFDNSDQRKKATFILPGDDLNSPGLESLGWSPAPSDFQFNVGSSALNKKFFLTFEELSPLLSSFGSPKNEKILRYADVLLMYAEASLMGGGGDGASAFQMVTDRAYGSGNSAAPMYNLAGVKAERRRELATEGWDRFTDLVRWGDIQSAMSAVGKSDFNINRDTLLPIPDAEIQLSNGILTQNPGYDN
ncbi:RagB/SusD family nutrient uptake outer membrane protein [Aestuariivivens sediminis]|uniref:RagB/SusD family nutrient uptake outer membrane protein n=1 Tax=Aestuariivivens sediminis TaxID=2913557 RepID=UPI001F5A1BC6|nr:RagB/SusD family nutrient uptake outer membrane protein [Aestuariivivens sediminis]